MVDTSIFDKLSLIYNFLKDNSLIFLVLLLIITIIFDYLYSNNSKEIKKLYIITIILILIYGLFEYYKPFISIIDVYITNLFRISYFPSIIEYFTMILITILLQIVSVIKFEKVQKNINLWIGFIIELLFIINVVAMKNITVNLNTITNIYENDLLLSIFQLTGIIFMLWIIFNLIVYITKLIINDNIEIPKLNDYE